MLGPNGAGKSTLLRAVAGLEELSRGSLAVGGHVWQDDAGCSCRPSSAGPAWSSRTTGCSRTSTSATTSPSPAGRPRVSARRGPGSTATAGSAGSGSPTSPTAARTSSPAARPSGWRWPGRSRASPRCCCSTSRWRRSTRARGSTYARSCASTSPTSTGPVVLVTHDPLEAMVLADRLLVIEGGPRGPGRHARPRSPVGRPRRTSPGWSASTSGPAGSEPTGVVDLDGGGPARRERPTSGTGRCWSRCVPARSPCTPTTPSTRAPATSGRARSPRWRCWPTGCASRWRARPPRWPTSRRLPSPSSGSRSGRRVWLSAKATEIEAYADLVAAP